MAGVFDAQNINIVTKLREEIILIKKSLIDLQSAYNNASKTQDDVNKKTENLTKIERDRLKLLDNLKKANSDNIQKNEELKVQLQEQNKINKQLAKEKIGLIGAYEKESRKLTDLRKKYKDLAVSGKENTKEARKLKDEITKLDGKLKKVDASTGQFQRNVGDYPGSLGRAGSAVQRLNMQFKALLANPIVLVIAAIAGAFIALAKALKRSEEGQNALNKISSVLSATLNVFLDIVTNLAEKLIKAFEDPQQAVKDLWESIKNNLVNRIKAVADLFIGLKDVGVNTFNLIGASIKGIFKDNDEDIKKYKDGIINATADIGGAMIQAATGLEPEKIIQGFIGITEEITREAKIAADLANKQAKLDKLIRKALVFEAKARAEINNLRETAAKKDEVSASDRLAALEKAIALETEIEDLNVRIAKEKLYIKATQNALGASTKEDLDEEARLRAEIYNAEAQAARKRKLLESERVSATKEVNKEFIKQFDGLTEENKKFQEELFNELIEEEKNLTEKIEEEEEKRLEAHKERIENQKELDKLYEQVRLEAEQSAINIITDQYNASIDNKLAKFMASNEAEKEIQKDRLDKGIISEAQYKKKIEALDLKARQESAKAEKKKALFDIGINTLVGVLKTTANLGLPAAIPFIAATIALGAIQASTVAAKPIPKFRHGSKGELKGDTMAIVGDGGKAETIIDPYGNYMLTPNIPTGVFLQKGSRVLSGEETEKLVEKNNEFAELIKETKLTRKAITSQKNIRSEFTPNAVYYSIEQKNRIERIRRRYI